MPTCFILRGVPGSGKTTLAEELKKSNNAFICSADDWMNKSGQYKVGEYLFNPKNLAYCHSKCKDMFEDILALGKNVIVANTNTTKEEFNFYFSRATACKYQVFVITVENYHGNKSEHNVPDSTMEKMKERFEINLG